MLTEEDGVTPISNQEAYDRMETAVRLLGLPRVMAILDEAETLASRLIPTVRVALAPRKTGSLRIHAEYGDCAAVFEVTFAQLVDRPPVIEDAMLMLQRKVLPRELWTDRTGRALETQG